jgi:ketosteroid isomerase-like protein
MASTTEATRAAFETYRRLVEAKDYEALARIFADDAIMVAYSKANPPGSGTVRSGRDAIMNVWRETPKELKHQVDDEVIGENRFAFALTCTYPSGQKVFGTYITDLKDGKIVRQVAAEAWDE